MAYGCDNRSEKEIREAEQIVLRMLLLLDRLMERREPMPKRRDRYHRHKVAAIPSKNERAMKKGARNA